MKVATYRIGFLVAFVTPTWRCGWKAVFLGGEALVVNFVWWEVSWSKPFPLHQATQWCKDAARFSKVAMALGERTASKDTESQEMTSPSAVTFWNSLLEGPAATRREAQEESSVRRRRSG